MLTTCTYSGSKVRAARRRAGSRRGRAKGTLELTFHPRARQRLLPRPAAAARPCAAAAARAERAARISRRRGSSATTCRITDGSRRESAVLVAAGNAAAARLGDDRVPARAREATTPSRSATSAGTTAATTSVEARYGREPAGAPSPCAPQSAYLWKPLRCCCCCCSRRAARVRAEIEAAAAADRLVAGKVGVVELGLQPRPPRSASMSPFFSALSILAVEQRLARGAETVVERRDRDAEVRRDRLRLAGLDREAEVVADAGP